MDITTLAAWGEFLGGIAVVVSLIYLAGQIRQNSRLLKASAAGVTWQSSNAQASLTVQDPELARIYWAGIADRESLSEQDRQRFDPLVGLTMTGTQQQLRLARDGRPGNPLEHAAARHPAVVADVQQPLFARVPRLRGRPDPRGRSRRVSVSPTRNRLHADHVLLPKAMKNRGFRLSGRQETAGGCRWLHTGRPWS
jgi:hypothetical protein